MSLRGVGAVVFDVVGTLLFPDPPAPVMYAQVGLAVQSLERTGRTYANGMFVEYLSVVGLKSNGEPLDTN